MRAHWHRIIVFLSLLVMEGCWLFAFISFANTSLPDSPLSAPLLMVFLPLSFIVAWLLERSGWHRSARLALRWLCWAASVLLMMKLHLYAHTAWSDPVWLLAIPLSIPRVIYAFEPALLVLLASALLWWLGGRAAQSRADFARLLAEFQFGLILMVIAFLIASAAQIEIKGVVPLALMFFSFSLVGVSTAHAREDSTWLASLKQGHWGWLLALSIGAILIAGMVIGSVISQDLLQVVVDGLKWLWGIILKILVFIAGLFPDISGEAELPPAPPPPGMEDAENFRLFRLSDEARSVLTIIMAVIWGSIVILALWRISSQIYRWLAGRSGRMEGVEVEQLRGAFWADLKTMVKQVWSALAGLIGRLFARCGAEELPGAGVIRNIYRQMTRWAAARGYPRATDQTPYEYMGVLAAALPEASDDLGLITRTYVQVRYGAFHPLPEEREAVAASWRRLRRCRLKRPAIYTDNVQEDSDNG